MTKKLTFAMAILLSMAVMLTAQTVGTVTFTPPAPGSFVATAGAVACTVTGNAVPATAVSVACHLGLVSIPEYTVPLPAGSAYTFDHHFNGDAVTVMLTASATGAISWQAAATPSGGTVGSGSGNF